MSVFVNSVNISLDEYNKLQNIYDKFQFDDTVVRMTNIHGHVYFYFVTKDNAICELETQLNELTDWKSKTLENFQKLEIELLEIKEKYKEEVKLNKNKSFWNLFKK